MGIDDNQQKEEYQSTPVLGRMRTGERYGMPLDSGYIVNPIKLSTQIPDNSFYISKLKSDKMTSTKILLEAKDGAGDCYIASAKTSFDDDTSGWWIGKVESDGYPKISIGNDTQYFKFDPSGSPTISISGDIAITDPDIFYKTSDTLDDISDGSTYGKVNQTNISGGKILLASSDSTGYTLDNIANGTSYGKVNLTAINAGNIILSRCDGNLDDIDDGSNYGKVALTDISAGHITLISSQASLNINNTTFGQDGIQLQYNAGNPRAYIGDGANSYFNFDGTKITWKAANTELDASGNLNASSATLSGAITATSGAIGGWNINATSIYTGTEDHSGYTANAGDMTIYSSGSNASIHAKNFYIDTNGNLTCTSATISGALTTETGSSLDGQYLSDGTVTNVKCKPSIQGWTHDLVFSVTDANTVSWTSGTITLADGTTYSIDAGNTGNMTAKTYVYLDTDVSSTTLQTTTAKANVVGDNKILIAICENSTGEALFQVFGSDEQNIDGSNIRANSIQANEIAANTITANEISANTITSSELTTGAFVTQTANITDGIITNAKISDLSVSKLTAGTITSKAITLAVSAGTGDSVIKAGKTDFGDDATSGFILGLDDSDGDKAKFEIGSSASKVMKYDGTDWSLIGGTITGGTIQTSTSGQRIVLTSDTLKGYDSAGKERIRLTGKYLDFYDENGTITGHIYADSTNGMFLYSVTGLSVNITEDLVTTKGATFGNSGDLDDACIDMANFKTGTSGDGVYDIKGTDNNWYVRYDGEGKFNKILPNGDVSKYIGDSSSVWLNVYANNYRSKSGTNLELHAPSAHCIVYDGFYPDGNALLDCGTSSHHWLNVYANNYRSKSGTNLELHAPSAYCIVYDGFYPDGNEALDCGTSSHHWGAVYTVTVANEGGHLFLSAADGSDVVSAKSLNPITDNAHHLGTDAKEWTEVWAYDTTINHSDINDKTDLKYGTLGLNFINELKPVEWKWKDRKKGMKDIKGNLIPVKIHKRKHHGFIGQEVKEVLDKLNISDNDFAGYVKSKETGKCYLRYSEFIAPLVKAVQELSQENKEIKKQLAELRNK